MTRRKTSMLYVPLGFFPTGLPTRRLNRKDQKGLTRTQFEIDIYSETSAKEPVKNLVRQRLTPILRKKLATLGPALISSHAKDLQHAADANTQSTASTITSNTKDTSVPAQTETSKTSTSTTAKRSKVNVTTLDVSDEFRTSADQLYATFTDPTRLAAFTRAPPKKFTGTRVGGEFELFGGNVAGKFIELDPPKRIVQEWRLQQWPGGHYSRLELHFDQNDVDAVTVMRVSWTGVPVGQEEVTRRNWGEYYVRSIKTTFGFGTVRTAAASVQSVQVTATVE